MDAAMHAPLLRTTVVVTDAFAGRATELVELFKVLSQGSIRQVTRRGAAQSAELVVRRLKTRVEKGRVEVVSEKMWRKRKMHVVQ